MPNENKSSIAKPFLKWAGGKRQLIPEIEKQLPGDIGLRDDMTYIEPFVGSGAVFFWFIQQFNVQKAVINDINPDLINVYKTIKLNPDELIATLDAFQHDYFRLNSREEKQRFFIESRTRFNARAEDDITNAALFILLNRTCFNGLYRVNRKNDFNVPFGKYIKPKISDPENIYSVSRILQRVTILNGDYQQTLAHAGHNSFFYFDPPYKPISKTASFNAYDKAAFDDHAQNRLAAFTELLTKEKHLWLLSNSDPKNADPGNTFFDDLYQKSTNTILRVKAKRTINANAAGRGVINELLIKNY